jgi:proline iminopeptidase
LVGAGIIAVTVLLSPLLRSWYRRWGATDEEANRALPADDIVPHPKSEITCAVTVRAPAGRIWPWFVQMGCQRAGWYSYDLLDNGGVPSASRIIPEFQHIETGDVVKAMPKGDFGFPVAIVDPCRALCLAGVLDTKTGKPVDPGRPLPEAYFGGDQTFSLHEIDARTTRMIFRMRTDWNPSFFNNLGMRGFLEPISFVMMRKMLINIKQRAEKLDGWAG